MWFQSKIILSYSFCLLLWLSFFCRFRLTSAFVSPSLCMFRHFAVIRVLLLLTIRPIVVIQGIWISCHCIELHLHFNKSFLSFFRLRCRFRKIAHSPIRCGLFTFFVTFGISRLVLLLSWNSNSLFFGFSSELVAQILIFQLAVFIQTTRPLVTFLAHLLSHHLAKCAILTTRHIELALRFFSFNFTYFFNQVLDRRLLVNAIFAWLPLYRADHIEGLSTFTKMFVSASRKKRNSVVYFDTFVEDAAHKSQAVGSPFYANCTFWFYCAQLRQIV